MPHKAGFINIIGNPNVGKSTLMNILVGEKLSIVTPKMQTTRHRILGIVNGEDYQIVYSDTPGILKPSYRMQDAMVRSVKAAISDADIILYVTDVVETPDKNEEVLNKLARLSTPVILLINKIDLSDAEKVEALRQQWQAYLPRAEILAISALHGFNVEGIFGRVMELLPESPPFYPKDELTDKSERFFVSEIIREKILLYYKKEIPYSVEVAVEEFLEEEKIIRIRALIFVMRDSQKGIIIGKSGSALKKTATSARLDIEKFFGRKVFLEIQVKVDKDWRNQDNSLKRFGYEL
jgi:GTPase